MATEIRARFSKGMIEPLEKTDLAEDEEFRVIILGRMKGSGMVEALRSTAGGWKGLLDAEEFKRNVYSDRLVGTRPEPRL